MNPAIQRAVVGVVTGGLGLTGTVGTGTAPRADAGRPSAPAEHRPADILANLDLDGLVVSSLSTFWGLKTTTLSLLTEPVLPAVPGAEFYLYDPVTGGLVDGFMTDEVRALSLPALRWRSARFAPPTRGTIQVRFGHVDEPGSGPMIAQATVRTAYTVRHLELDSEVNQVGNHLTVFRLVARPPVTDGGEYFLFDRTHGVVLRFALADTQVAAVTDWRDARFTASTPTHYEVRYGDHRDPGSGVPVASATPCRPEAPAEY